ncbi:MAG: hypothetical protein M3Q98_00645 [Actinomycetota bacterium]|nr:hypothetical protein [Actinomycetota bacterium]
MTTPFDDGIEYAPDDRDPDALSQDDPRELDDDLDPDDLQELDGDDSVNGI